MKTLIKPFVYIISALMVLSFASCNDFLDKEPEGKVPEEKVDYTNLHIPKHTRSLSGSLLGYKTIP